MSALNIHYVPDSFIFSKDISLRKPSRELTLEEIKEPWFKNLLNDMFATLYSTSGIGLAAPQVGVHIQLAIIDIEKKGTNPIVLINPKYQGITDEKVTSIESCLSIPNFNGEVLRYKSIKVNALNMNGEEIELTIEDSKVFVFQHEIDHLAGKLYVDLLKGKEEIKPYSGYGSKIATKAFKNLGLNV